jgi:beta-lactamase regulating signal transducer with metallopeptidase domain
MNWPLLLIKVTLLCLAAFGAVALLRRSAASARHLIWSVLFPSVVALPLLSATLPRIDIPVPAAWQIAVSSQGHAGAAAARAVSARAAGAADRQVPPDAPGPAVDSARRVGDAPIRPSASRFLFTVWLTGALAALGALIVSIVRLGRLARTAAVVTDPAWQSAAASIGARLRLRVPVRIVESLDVDTPMAGGCWQPTVFLPAAARDWTTERRDVVLTHELAHLARRDPLRHALARVAVALYWFHPLVWVAAARASAAREAACDEAVIATGVRRSTYARILLDLSARATRAPLTTGALLIVQRSHLERRLLTILNGHARPAGRSLSFLTTAAIVVLLSVAAAQPINSATTGTTSVVGARSARTQAAANAPQVLTPVVQLVAASAQASAPMVVTVAPKQEVATRVETPAVTAAPPSQAPPPASLLGAQQRGLDRGLYEASESGDSVESIGQSFSGSNAQGRSLVTADDGIHIGVGTGRGVGRASGGQGGGRAVIGDDGIRRGMGRGVPVIGGVPIIVIDGTVQPSDGSPPEPGKLGIASECEPWCGVKRMPTGEYYHKYDSYPRVVQVRQRSAAERAGIQVGDLIIEVEGRSILEDGSILNLEQRDRLRMTVRRDDKTFDVALVIP